MHDRVVSDLRQLLRDLFVAKAQGNAHARLARAHGYVDGYMRAVLDLGVIEKSELLAMVTEERALSDGPATAIVRADEHVAMEISR
jgi:hypothetical protein